MADDLPKPKTTDVIRKGSLAEYTVAEEKDDGRRWRMFRIGEQDHRVDMKAIEPYKKVISHGGKDSGELLSNHFFKLSWGGRGRPLSLETCGNSFVAVLRHG